ncbi:MAG: DUF2069 domain-containing protein [Betaproteobacteria bacterium]|nr:DUF2069 domain-containing protein [Betaproteobacteria bacterium]
MRASAALRLSASAFLVLLLFLCLAWELWLAPLRPGGSYAALKALPLAIALPGILAGRRYTYQWTSMLAFAYFAEGAMRSWSDAGASRACAAAEVGLSLAFAVAAIGFVRTGR